MKKSPSALFQLYKSSLRTHLDSGARPDPKVLFQIANHIQEIGLSTLEFAKLHERFLVVDLLPECSHNRRTAMIRNAGNFFAAVITAMGAEKVGLQDSTLLRKAIETLSNRTVELSSANQQLSLEINRREKLEAALRRSEQHVTAALKKSEALKEQLRGLSRSVLSVQEEERRKISRELHDVIAQALVGINVRLATLKIEAGQNIKRLAHNIALTQKMVTKSADIVHRFALELRPAVLDDLGLIPALHSFLKSFTTRTGVRTHLTGFDGIEKLSTAKRTVLYRVAQEALTNVARHAHATRVDLVISKDRNFVRMEVCDDGKSFDIQAVLMERKAKRLGLLGMRERVEMVRGSFEIESEVGNGTKVIALIPVGPAIAKQWREELALKKSHTKR